MNYIRLWSEIGENIKAEICKDKNLGYDMNDDDDYIYIDGEYVNICRYESGNPKYLYFKWLDNVYRMKSEDLEIMFNKETFYTTQK